MTAINNIIFACTFLRYTWQILTLTTVVTNCRYSFHLTPFSTKCTIAFINWDAHPLSPRTFITLQMSRWWHASCSMFIYTFNAYLQQCTLPECSRYCVTFYLMCFLHWLPFSVRIFTLIKEHICSILIKTQQLPKFQLLLWWDCCTVLLILVFDTYNLKYVNVHCKIFFVIFCKKEYRFSSRLTFC